MDRLRITSPSFEDNDDMPKKYTGFGEDISPGFYLENLSKEAVSLAIIMDDLDIPLIRAYTHWLIWNLPATEQVPEGIPHGYQVPSLGNARQGVAYGVHCYRGPKQPVFVRNMHRYLFQFYVLDCDIELDERAKKKDLLAAMEGHILQRGSMTGKYKR